MITEFEKQIYNNHLVASRKAKNEPFKLKKDFSKLDEDQVMVLQKLSRLFNSYPNLIQEDFFLAPHKIYSDDDYYPLDFYTKPKAIKCYSDYMKQLELQDPDSSDSLRRLAESLKFVAKYCKEQSLQLSDYELNIEGTMPCFVQHLKDHKINYYTLQALTFKKPQIESEILEFIFPDFYLVFQQTKNKFYTSKKMKEFAKQAKIKLENKLNEKNNEQ
jgi:hypothetical protein